MDSLLIANEQTTSVELDVDIKPFDLSDEWF